MASMIKLLLVVLAIHITLIFMGIADIPMTSLAHFVTNPVDWGSTDFLALLSDLFLTVGVAAVVVAGTVMTRSDIFLFAGIAGVFLSFGLPLAELFSIVSAQSNAIVATVLVSPIILIYVITCVAWWRGQA